MTNPFETLTSSAAEWPDMLKHFWRGLPDSNFIWDTEVAGMKGSLEQIARLEEEVKRRRREVVEEALHLSGRMVSYARKHWTAEEIQAAFEEIV